MQTTDRCARSPIAIVGMACRLPGAPSLAALWRVLVEGRCTLQEVPRDRYDIDALHDPTPGAPGRVASREGGFLDDLRGFDAGLFQLSHREAMVMDPQHRQLLEVTWDAFEDAGMPLARVSGSRAGVYVGLFTSDYRERMLRLGADDLDVYSEIGTTRSSAAGRISHAFNLTGPAAAVDSACASSLVAVHLACQSVWSGDADFAVAGGCNVVLEADTTVSFSRSRMLSPGGRCRFGDADADGFVRSEGVAVVILKRLDHALRDGDRVYAVVREAEVSNDARMGKGLFMTPSVEGQEELLQRAWIENNFDLDRLAFIEAHGTGTKAGDPTECAAIARVLGARRGAHGPLLLGSIKTNIGHTEGAAGVAGLLKATLALHHRMLPASLHFRTPNPDIPWAEGRIAVATENTPLPTGSVLAGVSSFGLSGTNAHIVLESFHDAAARERSSPEVHLLPVSAHTPEALRARVASLADALEGPDAPSLDDLCHTAGARRTHLVSRAAFVGATRGELLQQLRAEVPATAAQPASAPLAMVFPGQGGQWAGMGRGMLRASGAFREALAEVDDAVRALGRPSVRDDLTGDDDAWARDPARLQPALFAVELALAAWWRSVGVVPAAVVGHSMGEVAAACAAGALSVDDGARVMCVRSALLSKLRGLGRMAVLGVDVDGARALIDDLAPSVSVAVQNARSTTVVSGDAAAVREVLRRATARGAYASLVDVDAASHSALVDPHLDAMRDALAGLRPRASATAFFSTVDAAWRDGATLDADYWCANLRRSVRFWEASTALLDAGYRRFVEAGPHPVLVTPLLQTIRERDDAALAVGTTRRGEPELRAALTSLAGLYAHGVDPDWSRVQPAARCVSLPSFPFQHEPFWFREGAPRAEVAAPPRPSARAASPDAHPLLGDAVLLGGSATDRVWSVPLSTARFPYLEDHLVRGSAILPGAAFVELALAAARHTFPERPFALEDTAFHEYLAVPSLRTTTLQVQLRAVDAHTCAVRFYTFDDAPGRRARLHAESTIRLADHPLHARQADPFRSPRALVAEALRVEMARAEANPAHRFAVLSATQEGSLDAGSLDAVARVLREIVRREDEVFTLAEGRWALLLRGVSASVSRAQVAARLRSLARDRLAHLTPAAEVRLQLVDVGLDAHRTADDLAAGRTGGARPGMTSMPPPVERVSLGPEAFYTAMERRGVSYGPAFRPVLGAEQSAGSTVSRLEVPLGLRGEMARYSLHPAVLDGCFQAAAVPFLAARSEEGEPATFLPVGVGRVVSLRPPSASLTCRAWLRPSDSSDDGTFEVDVVITDDEEHTIAEIDRLRLRRVSPRDVPRLQERRDELFHAWRWVEREALPAAAPVAWTVVGDSPLARSLADRAGAAPDPRAEVHVIVVDPADPDDVDAASAAPLALAREVSRLRAGPGRALRVVVVTTEGATPRAESPSPAHAGVIALCRVVANERPELVVQSIDLPADPTPADLDRLVDAVSREALDDEIAIRGGVVYARQLTQSPPTGDATALRSPAAGMVTALVSAGDRAAFTEVVAPEAAVDEVELHVRAAVVAREGGRAAPVALVGEVARESAVAGLRAGARVVAWVRHQPAAEGVLLASRMAISPACAAAIPDGVTDLQALAAAALYLEPALAIQRIAAARLGERVLVHEADGPRGRAACDLARAAGAIVLASASSFADRDGLRASGVAHALQSRDGDLPAAVLDLTASEGAHVIVLAGREAADDLVVRAAALGARVVRLGGATTPRADAARNAVVGEVDVDAVARTRPAAIRQQLRALLDDLASGALDAGASLPAAAPLADVPQELASAVGPVVVLFEHPRAPVPLPATVRSRLRPDATYLLTGGTGGLGLALAAWLVGHGAKHLCLVSRGAPSAEASAKVEALRLAGATVTCARAAVEDRAALAAVIHDIDASAAPLRGVFHLAGALDDATLDGLTRAHFDAVMRPKLLGARNLHALTRHHPIEHFVLFGSAAAVLGSAAQGNYAAANAAMDALALRRRADGLPALSVAWGVWGEVGLAARAENRGARLDARGLGVMSPGDALDALGRLLAHGAQGEAGVFAIDWARWTRAYPRAARGSRFAALVPRAEVTARTLDDAPVAQRAGLAGERVRQMLAEVLRVPAARLAPTQSLAALGLDSLMTVELRARILDVLGVDLAPSRILSATTVEALAREVAANVAGAAPAPAAADAVPAADLALPDDLRVTPGDASPAASDVLLTGATGFVGAHVARALLDDGRAALRCLVRAGDLREARDRVLASLRTYGALREGDAARIVPVLGDLTLDGMGLSADTRAALARDVDAIVHAGARVNHMFPYARLRDANVRGTAEVLRLAAQGRRKVVHHVSTLVVFPLGAGSSDGVDEASALADHAEPFFAGYAASKWAAEHLCLAARARGLDVRVHRPAQITGSTLAAVSPATDVLWRLVATALTLGVAPDLRGGVNLVPVDFVARAIAAVAFDPAQVNGTFHLMSPTSYPVASALGVLRQMGYPLRAVPAGDWIPLIERGTGAASALAPEVSRLHGVDLAALDASPVRCACDATFARLPPDLRAVASVDDALFARYVRELVARGALPAPPARAPRELPSHPPQA